MNVVIFPIAALVRANGGGGRNGERCRFDLGGRQASSETHLPGRTFTLKGISHHAAITLGESDFPPPEGRQYVKVCGTVTAPEDAAVRFRPGIDANMFTDRGMGFAVDDDRVTDWSEVGTVPAEESREACEVWEVPAGAGTVYYAVNYWLEHPSVYRVELSPEIP